MLVIIMKLLVVDNIPQTTLLLPLFINIDWFVINNVCDSFCAGTIHFLCFAKYDLLELNVFAFGSVVANHLTHNHSCVNTGLTNAKNLLLDKSFSAFLLPTGFYISKVSKQRLVFGYF